MKTKDNRRLFVDTWTLENRGKWLGESAKRVKEEEDLTNDEMLALDEDDDFSDLVADDELDLVDGDELDMTNTSTNQTNEAKLTNKNELELESFRCLMPIDVDRVYDKAQLIIQCTRNNSKLYSKKVEREPNEDYNTYLRRCKEIAEKDKQLVIKELKAAVDDFDRKVLKTIQQFGYSNT